MSLALVEHQTAALGRLAQFLKGKPNVAALLATFTNRAQELEVTFQALLLERSLETAIGAQLDQLGAIVGQIRAALSDDDYRTFIRARIRVNLSSGTTTELLEIFELLVPLATVLATPVISSVVWLDTLGGTLVPGTYAYRVAAINAYGHTLASVEVSVIVGAGTNTNRVQVNWGAITGATGYEIYARTVGAELLLATVGQVILYIDTGAGAPAGALPVANTAVVETVLRVRDEPPAAFTLMFNDVGFTSAEAGLFIVLVRAIKAAGVRAVLEYGNRAPATTFKFDAGSKQTALDNGHFRGALV